jgi:hypothetical protein
MQDSKYYWAQFCNEVFSLVEPFGEIPYTVKETSNDPWFHYNSLIVNVRENRRSYHEWTIHEETISTFSTEEAIKNGQCMKRQYLHSAQKKLSRMDNTWRDNIYIEHRRSYHEWTIHEETISTFSTEEAIKNGKYTKRQYLHWAQKKLSRIRQSILDSFFCAQCKYCLFMYCPFLIASSVLNIDIVSLSRMDNTWRDNIYIQHRRSYQEWKIHEETISTLRLSILDSFFCAECR